MRQYQYAKPLNKLINELSKLPGIGGKTAQRLAFHILSMDDKDAFALADAVRNAKTAMTYCSVCGNLTDQDPWALCSDDTRDKSTICVVENPRLTYFRIHNYLVNDISYRRTDFKTRIGTNCNISSQAVIADKNVIIGNNVTI